MKKILLAVALLTTSMPVFAADLLPQETPGFFGRKVRDLGMGNVGISILGTTESSAFYNPAGLNDITHGEFRFMNITTEVSENSLHLPRELKNLYDNINADGNTDAGKVRDLNNFINDHTGEFQHFRVGMELFSYARKNFAAGLLFNENLDTSFRDESFPHFDMRSLGDAGGYIAFSQGFWDKLFQVGVTFKPVMRFSLDEADQQITYADVTTKDSKGDPILKDQFKNIYDDRQFGLPIDFGMKSNLSFAFWKNSFFIQQLRPQVGFTWEDAGSQTFYPLPSQGQTVNAGMSINPQLFWRIQNLFAVEFREINRDRPVLSKLHVGTEFKFPYLLAIRGGLSEGYATGGITLDFVFFKIDAAAYYEEVGYYTREDGNLRYAASFGFKI